MTIFKHCFWDVLVDSGSSTDLSTSDMTKIKSAASNVQNDNKDDVLFGLASRGDGKTAAEISLVIQVHGRSSAVLKELIGTTLTDALQKALDTQFAKDDQKVTVEIKEDVRVFNFDDEQMKYVQSYRASFNLEKTCELHKILSALPKADLCTTSNIGGPSMTFNQASTSPSDDPSAAFSLSLAQYTTLQAAKGDDIKTSIESLQEGLSEITKETKSAVAAVMMVTKGIVTIGKEMWASYQKLSSSTTTTEVTPEIVLGLISACGFGVVSAVIAGLVAVVGVATILFKDDLNILLLVNGQGKTLTFNEQKLRNGERRTYVNEIAKVSDTDVSSDHMAYPCGIYIYQKSRVAGAALGFFGSTAGISFDQDATTNAFAVAADCPNTILGGNNAVHVYLSATAEYAATQVDQSKDTDDLTITLNGGKCTVTRADKWGNINYCVCILTA